VTSPASVTRNLSGALGSHRNWFAKRPRFHGYFTPTYGSWLNLVERWFADLTNKQLRRCVHRGVAQLKASIRESSRPIRGRRRSSSGPKAPPRSPPASRGSLNRPSTFRPRHLFSEPRDQDIGRDQAAKRAPYISQAERGRHETNSLRLRHDGDLGARLCETDSRRRSDRSLSCGTVHADSGGLYVVTVAVLELQD
jgi:hypothetical protein